MSHIDGREVALKAPKILLLAEKRISERESVVLWNAHHVAWYWYKRFQHGSYISCPASLWTSCYRKFKMVFYCPTGCKSGMNDFKRFVKTRYSFKNVKTGGKDWGLSEPGFACRYWRFTFDIAWSGEEHCTLLWISCVRGPGSWMIGTKDVWDKILEVKCERSTKGSKRSAWEGNWLR